MSAARRSRARAAPDAGRARSARLAAVFRSVCALELAALKPGNVHRRADGHGMTLADFLRSAEASAGPLTTPGLPLGERVYRAVAATRAAVGCNTNLGILLLAGPLIQAALECQAPGSLRERLVRVLAGADRADTDALFRAIRLAAPGGLGESAEHDVNAPAAATPVEVMTQAASRDRIALQYATGYADLFDRAVPRLTGLQRRWRSPAWAVAGLYMELLGRFPDTHIVRKRGEPTALAVCERAAPLAAALLASDRPQRYRGELMALDRWLKDAGLNPGTSADLTVASVLIDRLASVGDGATPQAIDSSRAPAHRRRAQSPGPDAPEPDCHAPQTHT